MGGTLGLSCSQDAVKARLRFERGKGVLSTSGAWVRKRTNRRDTATCYAHQWGQEATRNLC